MNQTEVAAFYYPSYHPDCRNDIHIGKGWTEWNLVKTAFPRFQGHKQPKHPLWGFEDESDPAVMEKKIDAASDHGINAWIFDWYYYDDGPFLQDCLDSGFLSAVNRNRIKFALMWANHDWYYIKNYNPLKDQLKNPSYSGKVRVETFEKIMDLVIEKYFKQPNYWKIDGCPYFSIYEINTLALSYDSTNALRAGIDLFRAKVKKAGFPDLHLNIIYCGEPNLPGGRTIRDWHEAITLLGVDSATSYTWVHHGALGSFPCTEYAWARDRYLEQWAKARELLPVEYFPNVTMGWDNSPRALPELPWEKTLPHVVNPVLVNNTPAEFQKSLAIVKSIMDSLPKPPKVVTINAWNEWPETSILEPEKEFGYGYLEAIREVFCRKDIRQKS
jgi:hypothetical protein